MQKSQKPSMQQKTSIWVHLFFILFCIACLLPFVTVISASISNEQVLKLNGFSVLPQALDFSAYQYLLEEPMKLLNAYKVTIFTTVLGTVFGVLFMSMAAYTLARDTSKFKKILTWYIFFPTLFSGGLVSEYIVITQYYHLRNNLLAIVLPSLINVFQVFMIRSFFSQLPAGLFDAARIDGANEYTIFFRIALPLSKPCLATVGFLNVLSKWNSWYLCMLYIQDDEKATLQYLLQKMMRSIEAILKELQHAPMFTDVTELPGENLRMAMLIVAIGPMMLIFPFFQKYFTKGMTVGSVKG